MFIIDVSQETGGRSQERREFDGYLHFFAYCCLFVPLYLGYFKDFNSRLCNKTKLEFKLGSSFGLQLT